MNDYWNLSPDCSLKLLESPHLYNKTSDTLYELDDVSLVFVAAHQSIKDVSALSEVEREFVSYCISERIFVPGDKPAGERSFSLDPEQRALTPSLRYLLLHITEHCNLYCKHCYCEAGPLVKKHMPLDQIFEILEQFQRFQGLIVMVSGGEPMMHPDFWRLNEAIAKYDLRFELLTNGTLITPQNAGRLNFHQVQVSLDGLAPAHDFLRGQGNYEKTVTALQSLRTANKAIAVSTIAYRNNLNDFEGIGNLMASLGINQWLINGPTEIGRWKQSGADLSLSPATIAEYMVKYSRGEGSHVSPYDQICGSHLFTVFADGKMYPCPMVAGEACLMGVLPQEDLRRGWVNKIAQPSDLQACQGCEFLKDCKGGCRFRAHEGGSACGRDLVSCALFQNHRNQERRLA